MMVDALDFVKTASAFKVLVSFIRSMYEPIEGSWQFAGLMPERKGYFACGFVSTSLGSQLLIAGQEQRINIKATYPNYVNYSVNLT